MKNNITLKKLYVNFLDSAQDFKRLFVHFLSLESKRTKEGRDEDFLKKESFSSCNSVLALNFFQRLCPFFARPKKGRKKGRPLLF